MKSWKISEIGFGTGPLGGAYGTYKREDGLNAIEHAIKNGINYFDSAPLYGLTKSETELGICLEQALKNTKKSRSDIYISTKCGRYGWRQFDYSPKAIKQGFKDSLKRLKTDYVDLLILHDVEFINDFKKIGIALETMEELKKEGLAKNIGISGLPVDYLLKVCQEFNGDEKSRKIDGILAYCHSTLQNQFLIENSKKFSDLGVSLISASPFGMGLLTKRGPYEWHPATKEIREACAKAVNYCEENEVDIAKLAVQYSVMKAKGVCLTNLLGMKSQKEVDMNLNCVNEKINEKVLGEVLKILKPVHNKIWVEDKKLEEFTYGKTEVK